MKKGLTFTAEGQMYQLRYDVNALCEIEDLLDKPISEIGQGTGMRELRTIFACGVLPKMQVNESGDVMSAYMMENGMDKLSELIMNALNLAMGEAQSKQSLEEVVNSAPKVRKKQ